MQVLEYSTPSCQSTDKKRKRDQWHQKCHMIFIQRHNLSKQQVHSKKDHIHSQYRQGKDRDNYMQCKNSVRCKIDTWWRVCVTCVWTRSKFSSELLPGDCIVFSFSSSSSSERLLPFGWGVPFPLLDFIFASTMDQELFKNSSITNFLSHRCSSDMTWQKILTAFEPLSKINLNLRQQTLTSSTYIDLFNLQRTTLLDQKQKSRIKRKLNKKLDLCLRN